MCHSMPSLPSGVAMVHNRGVPPRGGRVLQRGMPSKAAPQSQSSGGAAAQFRLARPVPSPTRRFGPPPPQPAPNSAKRGTTPAHAHAEAVKSPPKDLRKPRAGTVTALKIAKLEEEEAKLRSLEELAATDCPQQERDLLAKQKAATMATITKIKSKIINIQMRQDNHLEGELMVKLPEAQAYAPLWCSIVYPELLICKSKQNLTLIRSVRLLDTGLQLVKKESGNFEVVTTLGTLLMVADSERGADKWLRMLAQSADVGIVSRLRKPAGAVVELKRSAATLETNAFTSFPSSFSPNFMPIPDATCDSHTLVAGSFDDVCLWLLLASEEENVDFLEWAGLLFYYQACLSATELQEKLCTLFVKLQDDIPGLNFALRKQTADSLVNLARQWFASPYLSRDTSEEVAARRALREFCLKQQPEKLDALELTWKPHTTLGLREVELGVNSCSNAGAVAEAALHMLTKNKVADIADQLTVIDAELYERVPASELVAKRFKKTKLSPTLSLLKSRVNVVTHWCAHVIVFSRTDADRLQCFKRFIAVAEHLVGIRNYGGAGAFVGGLTSTSVSRLKRLREALPTKYAVKLEKLAQTFSPMENYRQYRALPDHSPFVPYLPVCLKDLTYVTDGLSVHYKGQEEALAVKTLVSFAEVLHKMGKDRQVSTFDIRPDDTLFPFFCKISHVPEDDLYNRSCELQKGRSLKKAASVAHFGHEEANSRDSLPRGPTASMAVPSSPQVPPSVVLFKLPSSGIVAGSPEEEVIAPTSPKSRPNTPPPVGALLSPRALSPSLTAGVLSPPRVFSPPSSPREQREPPPLPANPSLPSTGPAPQRPPPPPPMEAEGTLEATSREPPSQKALPDDAQETVTTVVAVEKPMTAEEAVAAAISAPRTKKRKESEGHNPLAALEVDELTMLRAKHKKLLADVTGAVAILESAAQLGTNRGEECRRLLQAALRAGAHDW